MRGSPEKGESHGQKNHQPKLSLLFLFHATPPWGGFSKALGRHGVARQKGKKRVRWLHFGAHNDRRKKYSRCAA
jgi:hypothetical protein